jgi:putative endonuclease
MIKQRFNRWLGHQKEQEIADWLQQQGLEIVTQNYTCKGGEIDIIALAPIKDPWHTAKPLLFIEVKYRSQTTHGEPQESVTAGKQQKICRCAQNFLQRHPQWQNHPLRFDVIAQTKKGTPNWIEDAFQCF